jgi:hypothetical protein
MIKTMITPRRRDKLPKATSDDMIMASRTEAVFCPVDRLDPQAQLSEGTLLVPSRSGSAESVLPTTSKMAVFRTFLANFFTKLYVPNKSKAILKPSATKADNSESHIVTVYEKLFRSQLKVTEPSKLHHQEKSRKFRLFRSRRQEIEAVLSSVTPSESKKTTSNPKQAKLADMEREHRREARLLRFLERSKQPLNA